MSKYQICEHCLGIYKGDHQKCPLCKKDIVDDVTRHKIDNPFDRKLSLKAGSVRIGSPISYKKPIFDLLFNFIISITILFTSICLILQIGEPKYRLSGIVVAAVYLIAAYWIHPEPDHDSIQDSEVYVFPHFYHRVNWLLIIIGVFTR